MLSSGINQSVWLDTVDKSLLQTRPLNQDIRANVCVIGAGIAGMMVAYSVARAGQNVAVIDDGMIGSGETGRTTAHLVNALDDRYYDIERLFGEEGSRMAAESHTAAIQRIESIIELEQIDCDFERLDGYLFLGKKEQRDELERELEAARTAGLTDVKLMERMPLSFWDFGPALKFPSQAQFHPLKFLKGLTKAVQRDGGSIYTGTHADLIIDGRNGNPCAVTTTSGYQILCDKIVVCTNTPVNDWLIMHTKQAPYRTYVLGFKVPKGSVPHGLYWDTSDPYHYIRLQTAEEPHADYEFLIVGGEDHKTGQADDTEDRFRCIEEWTRARFPMAQEITHQWSGQIMEPVDYMGFIGKNPGEDQNTYIVTGDSGNGMTNAGVAGILITDLIMGRENPWEKLYDPSRITFRAATDFAKENLNVAEQYADWLKPGDVESYDEIPAGSGAVIRRGARKVAVYKAEDGTIHERSAMCPHLYCVVDWNDTEKSWDCPCHGSRFDAYGKVLNGPAISGLEPVQLSAKAHPEKTASAQKDDQESVARGA